MSTSELYADRIVAFLRANPGATGVEIHRAMRPGMPSLQAASATYRDTGLLRRKGRIRTLRDGQAVRHYVIETPTNPKENPS